MTTPTPSPTGADVTPEDEGFKTVAEWQDWIRDQLLDAQESVGVKGDIDGGGGDSGDWKDFTSDEIRQLARNVSDHWYDKHTADTGALAAQLEQAEARAVALANALESVRILLVKAGDSVAPYNDPHRKALRVVADALAATPPTEAGQPQDKCPKCGAVYRKAGSQWKCCDCVGEAGMVPAEDTKPTTLPKLPPGFYLASGDHDFHVAILGQVCWRTTAGAPRLDPRIEGYALTPLPLAAQPAQPARVAVKLPPTQTFVIHQQGGIEFTIAGKWLPVEGVLAALKAAGVEIDYTPTPPKGYHERQTH